MKLRSRNRINHQRLYEIGAPSSCPNGTSSARNMKDFVVRNKVPNFFSNSSDTVA